MEIKKGNIGPEVQYDISASEGALKASVELKGADGGAKLTGYYNLLSAVDFAGLLIKKLIPGDMENGFVDSGVAKIKEILK